MLRTTIIAAASFAATGALAADEVLPPSPPQVRQVTPTGARRGSHVELTVTGSNLGGVDAVVFDDARIKGRVLATKAMELEMGGRRGAIQGTVRQQIRQYELKLAVDVDARTTAAVHGFRLRTGRGSSNRVAFAVGDLPEVREAEPNGKDRPQAITLPATLEGAIRDPGDEDRFAFDARAGETLVFQVTAAALGSTLDPALAVLDEQGRVAAETEDDVLVHRIERAGRHVLRVTDAQLGGSGSHVYRIAAGALPWVASVQPSGAPRGAAQRFTLEGANLPTRTVVAKLPAAGPRDELVPLPVAALGQVKVVAGSHRQTAEREPNDDLATAQPLVIPSTIEGRIEARSGAGGDQDLFRFQARKGDHVTFSVVADRMGSPLDGEIAVLDDKGAEVPRALLRPVLQTSITLRHMSGVKPAVRFESTTGFAAGDHVLVGRELMRVADVPDQPDFDVPLVAFRGHRRAFLDTSCEGHALGAAIYKVEIHPPDAHFPSNGMPVFPVAYRNDDGGPGHGRDPRLRFEAPRDGVYHLRLRDRVGAGGAAYAYRLTAAPPAPDFALSLSPADPQVPRGGGTPVTVVATRLDDYDGPIDVQLTGLPRGFTATRGTIRAGEDSVALVLSAAAAAPIPAPAPLAVRGDALLNGRRVTRTARADGPSLIALRDAGEVAVVAVQPPVIEVEQGGEARIDVRIRRAAGYGMRVPLSVMNLPFMAKVPDVGLNGILVNEGEDHREIVVAVGPHAAPGEQTLIPMARIETRGRDLEFAGPTVRLRVVPRRATASR
jgi:hypothetical protein